MNCRPLPRFTHSQNYSERSLVLKSVTERNSMSCVQSLIKLHVDFNMILTNYDGLQSGNIPT